MFYKSFLLLRGQGRRGGFGSRFSALRGLHFFLFPGCRHSHHRSNGMILPGISGSFILVLLGKYFYIMEAVKTFNVPVMLVFIAGAAIGITTFSRVLSFALRKFHDITIAVLAGFMLGSLNKVWPWKETIETYVDSHGMTKPLVEANIAPNQFVWEAVGLMILGFGIVYFLEKLSQKSTKA